MEKRINIAIIIVIIMFSLFSFRLWQLQIIKGKDYKKIDEQNRLRVLNIPAPRGIIYDRNDRALVKNIPSFDIEVVREDLPGGREGLSGLAELIGMKYDSIVSRLKKEASRPFKPVVLKQDVSFREVAKVEARKIEFPWLQINVVTGREYIYGHSASHLLGYLGSPGIELLRTPEYSGVPPESFVGQFGVEKIHDSTLMGKAGKKIIEVNALGRIMKVVRIQRPVKGRDIKLTIDIDLQIEAEKNLKGKAGAVVALKPDTGEILVLASSPTFDPNLFVRGIKNRDWRRLVNDPHKPMLNRAIQSQYPPGSTFKIITAIAALEEGIIDKDTSYYCGGSIYFGRTFRCWKAGGHGDVDLHRAITESCDVYFYEIAKQFQIDKLAKYAFGFGLGKKTGVRLEGEAAGIVPTSAWKLQTRNERWFTGETLNTVIGQGYVSTTPIQMASMMAAVVNGGKLYEPYLLADAEHKGRVRSTIDIRPEHIEIIRKALMGVVNDEKGTGKNAYSDIVSMGGKTGTTQVIGGASKVKDVPEKFRDHAWFVAFAPAVNPQIAVSVFVEHGGHGSTGAAPIAKKIIETYYKQGIKAENENGNNG
jgi:penicillin-binding protein 2